MREFKTEYVPYSVEWAEDFERWANARMGELQHDLRNATENRTCLWACKLKNLKSKGFCPTSGVN